MAMYSELRRKRGRYTILITASLLGRLCHQEEKHIFSIDVFQCVLQTSLFLALPICQYDLPARGRSLASIFVQLEVVRKLVLKELASTWTCFQKSFDSYSDVNLFPHSCLLINKGSESRMPRWVKQTNIPMLVWM